MKNCTVTEQANGLQELKARLIAFYLPQFHPIPENDEWWGKGFTEWTNVAKSKPLFPGHHQPHLPADLGFYDLRLPEIRKAQADMAREHGIEAFCYWHYWFHGKRLLERPFNEVLHSGAPDFPFCLAWANESWSRRWLGEEKDILAQQAYSLEDDLNHIRWLFPVFADPRCVKVHDRPLFLIYRPKDLPDPQRTTDLIRNECIRNGMPEPFLIGINSHCVNLDCRTVGFDGTLSFTPQLGNLPEFMNDDPSEAKRERNARFHVDSDRLKIYDYEEALVSMRCNSRVCEHFVFPSIFVGWDNTPRRGEKGIVIVNSEPAIFGKHLAELVDEVQQNSPDERLVFLNAWNEWAEGNHLEPDNLHGQGYLEEVKRVNGLSTAVPTQTAPSTVDVSSSPEKATRVSDATKAIAFYLPQYHPIPENDEWWGKGFTEWTNVVNAKPQFPGHYQPHLPSELGFYDLRLPDVRKAQAELAKEYGIHGFCYYHYWFNGKLLLERPLHDMLNSSAPDFPFCLCWANEPWTRAWDGYSGHVLVEQLYSEEDDRKHIRYLSQFFQDKRYIKVDGKPLFIIYRANHMPTPQKTLEIMRDEAHKIGIGDIYLCRVESFPNEHTDPTSIGFDSALEFQPDWTRLAEKLSSPAYGDHSVYSYEDLVNRMITKEKAPYKRFPCVTPSWDNSCRRKNQATIFVNSSPKLYEKWLCSAIRKAGDENPDDRIVFINAWNEWGEGNHLEPDQVFGRAYLEATKNALTNSSLLLQQVASIKNADVPDTIEQQAKTQKQQIAESCRLSAEQESRIAELLRLHNHQLDDKDQRLDEFAKRLAERDQTLSELNGMVTDRDQRIHELLHSLSWKITSPLRTVYGGLPVKKNKNRI